MSEINKNVFVLYKDSQTPLCFIDNNLIISFGCIYDMNKHLEQQIILIIDQIKRGKGSIKARALICKKGAKQVTLEKLVRDSTHRSYEDKELLSEIDLLRQSGFNEFEVSNIVKKSKKSLQRHYPRRRSVDLSSNGARLSRQTPNLGK